MVYHSHSRGGVSGGTLQAHLCASSRAVRFVRCRASSGAGGPDGDGAGSGSGDDGQASPNAAVKQEAPSAPSAIDMLEKRSSKKKKSAATKGEGIKVVSPARDAALGKALTEQQIQETRYVQTLLYGGGFILFLGVLLATSGFFPEPVDNFIGDVIYPSCSYVVGLFLLGSSVYGIWKVRQED